MCKKDEENQVQANASEETANKQEKKESKEADNKQEKNESKEADSKQEGNENKEAVKEEKDSFLDEKEKDIFEALNKTIKKLEYENKLKEQQLGQLEKQKKLQAQFERLNEKNMKEELEVDEIRKKLQNRAQLLAKFQVPLPDLKETIGTKMGENPLAALEFTEEEKAFLNLPKVNKDAKIGDDFYSLNYTEREDLYDRIGIYRGLVIHSTIKDTVRQSFYNVLKRSPESIEVLNKIRANNNKDETRVGTNSDETYAATVLYRKSQYTGMLDSSYTFSEIEHQLQVNGIQNLSVSAAVTTLFGSGVGAGYGYNRQTEESKAQVKKMMYMTSNYYLPKIELSFDSLIPCASDEFVNAVHHALALDDDKGVKSYRQLVKVLEAYGHFIPTSVTLGGKLISTQNKEISSLQAANEESSRHAAEVKAAINTLGVSAEANIKGQLGKREQDKDKQVSEEQAIQFTAMGGEGSFLRDAGQWAQSLNSYKGWTMVKSDELILTISMLPEALYQECITTMRNYVQKKTVQELILEGSHFLFYGQYNDIISQYVRKDYCHIRSLDCQVGEVKLLTCTASIPTDGAELKAEPYEYDANSRKRQVWYMTAEGYIVCGALNNGKEFVLTAMGSKVVLGEKGRYPNQTWEMTGSGHIINTSLDFKQVLTLKDRDVRLDQQNTTVAKDQLWSLVDAGQDCASQQLKSMENIEDSSNELVGQTDPFPVNEKEFFFIAGEGGHVLSINKSSWNFSRLVNNDELVVTMLNSGVDYQRWRFTKDGYIVSKLYGEGEKQMVLTLANNELVMRVKECGDNNQLWEFKNRETFSRGEVNRGSISLKGTGMMIAFPSLPVVNNNVTTYHRKAVKLSPKLSGEDENFQRWKLIRERDNQVIFIPETRYRLINQGKRDEQLALAVEGGKTDDNTRTCLQSYSQDGAKNNAQCWQLRENLDGTYTIYLDGTDKVLDALNYGKDNGTTVQIVRNVQNSAQKWYLWFEEDGALLLRNQHSGKFLTAAGTESRSYVQLFDESRDSKLRKWKLSVWS